MEERSKSCCGAGHAQDCGRGCGSEPQGCHECQSTAGACGGCAGGCPHAAGNELQWDYDDTVLVFSSDMLEEESP